MHGNFPNRCNYQSKIVVVGNSNVGKTTLISKLCQSTNNSNQTKNNECLPTVGIDIVSFTTTTDRKQKIKLNFWDTAGQQKYRNIAKSFYKNADVVIFVFSILDYQSFMDISIWLKQSNIMAEKQNKLLIIVPNKIDQNQKFVYSDQQIKFLQSVLQKFTSRNSNNNIDNNKNLIVFQLSAKTGLNVQKFKYFLIQQVQKLAKQKNPLGGRPIYLSNASSSFLTQYKANVGQKYKCC